MHRRLPMFRPIIFLGTSLLVAAVLLLFLVRIDRIVVARGSLAGGTEAVFAPWEGRIEDVFVAPGDEVTAGNLLLSMESDALQAEETRIKARIENLENSARTLAADRKRLVSDLHPAQITNASRDLERARLELASAETRYSITKKLWDMGLTTKLELQDTELTLDLAHVALEEAEAAPAVLQVRQRSEIERIDSEIEAVTGQIVEESASLGETRRKLALDTLTAEVDGIIVGDNLFELEGQTVGLGQELLRLSTGSTNRFEGAIYDSGRASARPGFPVRIRLDGYPWLIHGTLPGRLDFVADRRSEDGGFPVNVSFDSSEAPGPLYDGMKGQARIVVEEKVSLGRLLLEKIVGTKEP